MIKTWRVRAFGIALCILTTGCATNALHSVPVCDLVTDSEATNWWSVRFEMGWPENESPAWHVDLILAHKIISPLLEKFAQDISLWRFHRRAIRDKTGHQFSFIFYSSTGTAKEVSHMVASSPYLGALKAAGVVVKDTYDAGVMNGKNTIEATSDAHWSPPVQKSWPYFIMGVSKTWLALVEDFARQGSQQTSPAAVPELLAFYKEVDESVNQAWQEEGGHAFLHHLNALFEYKDVTVIQKRSMTF